MAHREKSWRPDLPKTTGKVYVIIISIIRALLRPLLPQTLSAHARERRLAHLDQMASLIGLTPMELRERDMLRRAQ